MSEAKIELKIGEIQFQGQGEPDWVAKQLDKILAQAEKLIKLAPPQSEDRDDDLGKKPMGVDKKIADKTIVSFLKEKNIKNDTEKFLATAIWLEAKGQGNLRTKNISDALIDSKQGKLANSAQSLNYNVKKGYCEKKGKEFYVTEEGKSSL